MRPTPESLQRHLPLKNAVLIDDINGLVHGVLAMPGAQVDDRITAEVGISLVGSSARRRAQFEARTRSPCPGDNTLRTVFGVRRVGTFERIKVAKVIQVMQGGKA